MHRRDALYWHRVWPHDTLYIAVGPPNDPLSPPLHRYNSCCSQSSFAMSNGCGGSKNIWGGACIRIEGVESATSPRKVAEGGLGPPWPIDPPLDRRPQCSYVHSALKQTLQPRPKKWKMITMTACSTPPCDMRDHLGKQRSRTHNFPILELGPHSWDLEKLANSGAAGFFQEHELFTYRNHY